MQVITSGIGTLLLNELKGAADVKIAVAYFSPPKDVLDALCSLPSLALVISDEYAINNPYKIEKLPEKFFRGCIQTGNKKLHAKVFIVSRPDGSTWVLLGSANMTSDALNWNREACVAMESTNTADSQGIAELVKWFDKIKKSANPIDIEGAKKTFDARAEYRTERRTEDSKEANPAAKYWILKTRNGSNREEHWDQFEQEDVIAIGWEKMAGNPADYSREKLREALIASGSTGSGKALTTIRRFIDMKVGDKVVICDGFASEQAEPVHIYGLATVTGEFRCDPPNGDKWRFKHDADIEIARTDVSRDSIAEALDKGSQAEAIHTTTREKYENVVKLLRDSGVQVLG